MNIEIQIATKLITSALARGLTVSVNDGEEWTVKSSRDRATILDALCTTDMDTLCLRDAGEAVGAFWLIWGNEGDLIHDHTDNTLCADLYDLAIADEVL